MARVHLIYGYLGAGKTTYARALAREHDAVCLDLDSWYLALFTDGQPTGYADYEALDRLGEQLDGLWPELLRRGTDVVLDFGFWSRDSRDRARGLAAGGG